MKSFSASSLQLSIFLVSILICCSAIPFVTANLNFAVTGDKRKTIELGSFGYNSGGVIAIYLKSFYVSPVSGSSYSTNAPSPTMGFAIDSIDTAQAARSERDYSKATSPCFINDPQLVPTGTDAARIVFWLNGSNVWSVRSSDKTPTAGSASTATTRDIKLPTFTANIQKRGLYSIFFFNCKNPEFSVSMNAHVEQYNVDSASQKNFLSVGDQPAGSVYLIFLLFFVSLLVVWRRQMNAKSQFTKRVHQIIMFLLVVKTLTLLFETIKFFHYASTGEHNIWDFFYYVFLTLKGVTLFAVIVLLGSGWSSAKAFLSENDKKLLLFVLPAQVIINISIAILEETSEGNWYWGKLLDLFRFLDVICLLAVLLPLVWSMKSLRDVADHEEKAAVNLQRMRVFRTFYLVFVGYIYCTRVILVVITAALPFYMMWLAMVFREICALALYCYICYTFQPGQTNHNPYELIDPSFNASTATTTTEEVGGENSNNSADMEEMKKRSELQPPEEISSGPSGIASSSS